jgi:putative membrane-bound dehydrogenase-like protein
MESATPDSNQPIKGAAAMHGAGLGIWITVSSLLAAGNASASEAPRPVDSRLVFERIAAEPEIVTPTGIAVDGRGRILVIESHTHFRPEGYKGPPADRIRVFEDRDRDGIPECVGSFLEGTRMTMSVAVARDETIFVATRYAIYHLEDKDGDGKADNIHAGTLPAPIIRLDTRGDYPHNGLSGFAFDFRGNIYFGLGENLGADYRLIGSDKSELSGGGEGGNIYRAQPDGSRLERLATGFWNPFHTTFDAFGRLFAVDNDPDSRPPCRLLHIIEGGDYGYRFRNGRKGLHPFTAWNGELPGTLGMVAGTGEAPCGVIAYESDNLPADYRGTLLVTSWGDHRIEQYRLESNGASFRARMNPVVAGGDDFRPVGIAVAPDGALYISDWVDKSYTLHGKGRIWRLRKSSAALPVGEGSSHAAATADLDARSSAVALESLVAGGRVNRSSATAFLSHRSADVRALAARIVAADQLDLASVAANDTSPLVRAEALRRLADPAARDLLLKAIESDDPFLQQAARQGLASSLKVDEIIALVRQPGLAPTRRLGLLLILRESNSAETRALLPDFLASPDPSIQFAAIQWVGERRLQEFRPQLLDALASSAQTRTVFEATLAALDRLDRERRNPEDERAGEDYIAALLLNTQTPAAVLERGLRMLRPNHPALSLTLLKRLMSEPTENVRLEAVRTLCQSPIPGRFDVLAKLADDDHASLSLRAEAVAGLADDAIHERARVLRLATSQQPALRHEALRDLRGIALSERELAALRAANHDDDQALQLLQLLNATGHSADGLAGRSIPSTTSIDDWLSRLEGPADRAAGERVFFHSKGPGCARCHQVDGRGGGAGPDLSTLSDGGNRRRLVESIVTPSKEIAPQFTTWSVAKTDGTVLSGILLEQSPEGALVFADSQARRIVVKLEEIAERKPQAVSIMPDHLADTMTLQEFRDVLAFLQRRQ